MSASSALVRRPRTTRLAVPRAQSLPVEPSGEQSVGDTGLGRITVADGVVAKLASRAALEVDGVGASAPRVLGRELSGAGLGRLGVRSSTLGALPASGAQVDGGLAFVDLTISVRYPAPVRQVAARVRERVRSRVEELTGLQVLEVDVKVPALVRDLPRPQRVL